MNTLQAIEARRSVKLFDPDHRMSDQDERTLMEHTLLSPTSFNIQNWRFVLVKNPKQRAKVKAAAWNQAQVGDASLLVVLTADLNFWSRNPERYWANAPKATADFLVNSIINFYKDSPSLQRDEAMRSIGIASQTLMLAAKSMGYDSCPMVGFDPAQVAQIINLPDDHVIGMIVAVGKKLKDANPRGGQLPLEEVVLTDSF